MMPELGISKMGESKERHHRGKRSGAHQDPRECIKLEGEPAEQPGPEKHDDGEELQEQ